MFILHKNYNRFTEVNSSVQVIADWLTTAVGNSERQTRKKTKPRIKIAGVFSTRNQRPTTIGRKVQFYCIMHMHRIYIRDISFSHSRELKFPRLIQSAADSSQVLAIKQCQLKSRNKF